MRWNFHFGADRAPVQIGIAALSESDSESAFAEVVSGFHEAVSNGVRDEVLNRAFVFQIDLAHKAIHRFDEHA